MSALLVAPLHWGLGHATRCMPLIQEALNARRRVVLASDGAALVLLKRTFPQLETVELPAYNIRYEGNMMWMFMRESRRIYAVIRAEHQATQKIVAAYGINEILSDNRYGVWHKDCLNKFLCHQLAPLPPPSLGLFHKTAYQIHQKWLSPFDEWLIPDVATFPNLSGDLSHKFPLPPKAKFIGILSRFQGVDIAPNYEHAFLNEIRPQAVAIISGPEPERWIFQESLRARFKRDGINAVMVLGKPEIGLVKDGNICQIGHLGTADLAKLIVETDLVISRSGYSSLMDYVALKRPSVELHPTRGQTEQLYLAKWWQKSGRYLAEGLP